MTGRPLIKSYRPVCEDILEDEEAMAEKLIVELPEITSTYLELLFLCERRKLVTSNGSEFGQIRALTRFAPKAA